MKYISYPFYFLLLCYVIIIPIGLTLYRNGRHYLLEIFHHDIEVTDSVNKILLVAYYLVNLGFSTIMVSFCNDYKNPLHNAELYAIKLGIILWSLGGLHYCNVVLLNHFKIQIQLFFHPKNSSI
ncbi:MAG: hypothetical protein U0U67_16130 [Chitinophagales bacterium]